jgi:L-aspartate oxidase
VHGANRLASNSLLEGLVFGLRAASAAVAFAGQPRSPMISSQDATLRAGQFGILEDVEKLRSSLRRTMWGQVGVIRSGESLIRACAQLSRWGQLVSQPFASRAALEVKNMIQVAQCVAEAALWRENSVGAHYRSDFPETKRAGWQQHSRLSSGEAVSGKTIQKSRGLLLSPRGRIG